MKLNEIKTLSLDKDFFDDIIKKKDPIGLNTERVVESRITIEEGNTDVELSKLTQRYNEAVTTAIFQVAEEFEHEVNNEN